MSNSLLHQQKRLARSKQKRYEANMHRPKRKPAIHRETNHHNK